MAPKGKKGICNIPTENFRIVGVTINDVARCKLPSTRSDADLHAKIEALGIEECFVVGSCNRAQFFYFSKEDRSKELLSLISDDPEVVSKSLNLSGTLAVRYLLESSMGVNSYVTGDQGIYKQMLRSMDKAAENGMMGMHSKRIKDKLVELKDREFLADFKAPSESDQAVRILERQGFQKPLKIMVLGTGEVAENTMHEIKNSHDHNISKAEIFVASKDEERLSRFSNKHDISQKNQILYNYNEPLNIPSDIDHIIKCRESTILSNYTPDKKMTVFDLSSHEERQVNTSDKIALIDLATIQDELRSRPEVQALLLRKEDISIKTGGFVKENFYPEKAGKLAKLTRSIFTKEPCSILSRIRISNDDIMLPGR